MHQPPGSCTNCGRPARIASGILTRFFPGRVPLFSGDWMMATDSTHQFTAVDRRHARLQCANAAAADRHRIILGGVELDQFTVARPSVSDDTLDVHDVATMHP